jgi:hypothetical protein
MTTSSIFISNAPVDNCGGLGLKVRVRVRASIRVRVTVRVRRVILKVGVKDRVRITVLI